LAFHFYVEIPPAKMPFHKRDMLFQQNDRVKNSVMPENLLTKKSIKLKITRIWQLTLLMDSAMIVTVSKEATPQTLYILA